MTKKPEETKVDVTMTPEERDKFVAFIAAQKDTDALAVEGKEKVLVDLNFNHSINGIKMGPGKNISVPYEWVGTLQRAENSMRDHELKLLSSTNRMFEILQSGQTIEKNPKR